MLKLSESIISKGIKNIKYENIKIDEGPLRLTLL